MDVGGRLRSIRGEFRDASLPVVPPLFESEDDFNLIPKTTYEEDEQKQKDIRQKKLRRTNPWKKLLGWFIVFVYLFFLMFFTTRDYKLLSFSFIILLAVAFVIYFKDIEAWKNQKIMNRTLFILFILLFMTIWFFVVFYKELPNFAVALSLLVGIILLVTAVKLNNNILMYVLAGFSLGFYYGVAKGHINIEG